MTLFKVMNLMMILSILTSYTAGSWDRRSYKIWKYLYLFLVRSKENSGSSNGDYEQFYFSQTTYYRVYDDKRSTSKLQCPEYRRHLQQQPDILPITHVSFHIFIEFFYHTLFKLKKITKRISHMMSILYQTLIEPTNVMKLICHRMLKGIITVLHDVLKASAQLILRRRVISAQIAPCLFYGWLAKFLLVGMLVKKISAFHNHIFFKSSS